MLNQAEYYVKKQAEGTPELPLAVEAIIEYITKGDYYQSKEERLMQWQCYEGDLEELVLSIFTICLQGQQTYQGLVGMLAGKIPMTNKRDRLQTMAEVIAVVANTGLIRITRGSTIMVDTAYVLEGIPQADRHEIVHEPPEEITKNFTDQEGSMLLGSSFNFHKGNICLDHINRMNKIQLTLNIPFLCAVTEEPKKPITDAKKKNQWDKFVKDSRSRYLGIGRRPFHQLHKYDARGRVYACGYHVNYQGSSYKKAMVQLAKGEKLNVL